MDLLNIGTQCSHPSCNELDFLPITCRCDRYFCREHIAPDIHNCPVDLSPEKATPFHKLRRCAVDTCTKPTLNAFYSHCDTASIPETCSQCQQSFCAIHRHPKSHVCNSISQQDKPIKNSGTAQALLAKNFPTSKARTISQSGAKRVTKVPTDPIKLAQHRKVELMKIRHKAIPGDAKDKLSSPPQDQRINIQIDIDASRKAFWFRKTLITGKVLDCLASHARIPSSDSSPLQLVKFTDSECVLRNDHPFADEVEDGDILYIRAVSS
ncbi:hypothetical protein BDZ94DRAFT_1268016 [Collybia nuda]|uniref:AN1-type domain-containing protein n=1 Tax=Collybia nuda TaxID=64659 RepID=A0A9P6CBH9_9AGAR|nr:hypothetical protein BDZ94DRAFT_1268016 [Collybia nuda]